MFGDGEAKRVGQAEADRICGLPVADVAAELMPAFAPDGPGKNGLDARLAMKYLLRSVPHKVEHEIQLEEPAREGLQMLEHARLITLVVTDRTFWATRLGTQALAQGTVQQYLDDLPHSRAVLGP